MEKHAKAALSATKNLHKRLREWEDKSAHAEFNDGIDWEPLKKLAADANKAIQAMQRHASDDAVRADVRENILREAVRDELIDREANAARVLDRQRTLAETQHGGVAVFERSIASARAVEAAVGALCPHHVSMTPGAAVLASGR